MENNLATNPNARVYLFLNNNESHIGTLTSSIVDATALSEEIFKGGPIVPVALPQQQAQQQPQQNNNNNNNNNEVIIFIGFSFLLLQYLLINNKI